MTDAVGRFHSEAVLIECGTYLYAHKVMHITTHPLTQITNQPNTFSSIHLFLYALACVASVSVWFSEQRKTKERDFWFWPASFFAPKPNGNACYAGYVCAKFSLYSFATLETRRELEPKCILQVFLGSLLGMHWSAIGLFSPNVPSNSARIHCEI